MNPDAWVSRAILLIGLGFGLLPLGGMVLMPMMTSVSSGESRSTNQVFVSKSSEAARRGFALPGEGRAAFQVLTQTSRSTRIFVAAACEIGLGIVVLAAAAALRKRDEAAAASRASGGLLEAIGAILAIGAMFAIGGAIVGFLLIGPIKIAPEGVFNFSLVAIVVGSLLFAYLRGPSFLRD